ncbi:MAG: hypothetical protein JEZ09_07530 [Salinivirgaceae bacterium]|nr:hypothetical protein [Salinivirgaceae bacterium]
MKNLSKIIRITILSIISMILFLNCKKDNNERIPDTIIYIDPLYINDPEYQSLFKIPYSTYLVENEGYEANGILIINLGENNFAAYDCTCTNEVKNNCFVRLDDDSSVLAKCTCCGSKFELFNGSVNKGPAEYPLKKYKTAFNGEYLRVYN